MLFCSLTTTIHYFFFFSPATGVLENFIAAGPPIYQQFVMERLERTIKMGMRKRPPTSLEVGETGVCVCERERDRE